MTGRLLFAVVAVFGLVALASGQSVELISTGTLYTDSSCTAGAISFMAESVSYNGGQTQSCVAVGTGSIQAVCAPANVAGSGNQAIWSIVYHSDNACATVAGGGTATGTSAFTTCTAVSGSIYYAKVTNCEYNSLSTTGTHIDTDPVSATGEIYTFTLDANTYTDSACSAGTTAFSASMAIQRDSTDYTQTCVSAGSGRWVKGICIPANFEGSTNALTLTAVFYSDSTCATASTIGVATADSYSTCELVTTVSGTPFYFKASACDYSTSGGSRSSTGGAGPSSGGGGGGGNPVIVAEEPTDLITITTGGSLFSNAACTEGRVPFSLSALFEPVSEDVDYQCVAVGTRYMRGACVPGDISTQEGATGNWRVRFYSESTCESGYLGQAEGEALNSCVLSTVAGTAEYVKVDGCSSSDAAGVKGSIFAALLASAVAFLASKMQL